MQSSIYQKYFKRCFDVFFALLSLFIFSPLFLVISVLIKLSSKGPIFFVQKRVGRNHNPFLLYKFRSMKEGAKGLSITVKGDNRITFLGKYLRKTKLDEFPQLLNVLKGDMSFVGSRPEVDKYVSIYSKEYRKILSVRPGITDWAAIKFRDEETILSKYTEKEKAYIEVVLPVKMELSLKYTKNINFYTDLKILILTIVCIFFKKD